MEDIFPKFDSNCLFIFDVSESKYLEILQAKIYNRDVLFKLGNCFQEIRVYVIVLSFLEAVSYPYLTVVFIKKQTHNDGVHS